MPRNYKTTPGKRSYSAYSTEAMVAAVEAVNKRIFTVYTAAREFGVPYGTLFNRVNELHTKTTGGQTFLTEDQEADLRQAIEFVGEWGFPLTPFNIRRVVKTFLDDNHIDSRFPGNMPGEDWMESFLRRSRTLSSRWTENIKRSRAKVSAEILNPYFDNLTRSVQDVPPENFVNYDETNFADDPEAKKVIVRRGQKHVENVLDHSKTSYSVMFAGTADGKVLPPYVVYGSVHLYPDWTVGGPANCRYNRTPSGWFDSTTVENWFETVALRYFKSIKNDKPRVLIGDNVASHFSYRIIKGCLENNIRIVFLPPNATHLCQPLDVAYFRPLKTAWRETLDDWKKQHNGCVPKHWFPRLLKKALNKIQPNSQANMKAGFAATGIYPLNRQKVLKRLPGSKEKVNVPHVPGENQFSPQLVQLLKEERFGKRDQSTIPKRKRLVEIQPGESVTEEQALQLLEAKRKKEDKVAKKPIKKEVAEIEENPVKRKKENKVAKKSTKQEVAEIEGNPVKITIKTEPEDKDTSNEPPKQPGKRRATKLAKGPPSAKRIRT